VVGVDWDVTEISGKFLGRNGGSLTAAVKAVDYFTALKQRGLNVAATNSSWGGGGYSQALYDALSRADETGALASFSQYGAKTVDVGAPGVGVWSTTAFNGYSSYAGGF